MKLKISKLFKLFSPKEKEAIIDQREINFFRNTNGRYFKEKLINHNKSK